jgi:DNA-binding GntR family transcriptional regulator
VNQTAPLHRTTTVDTLANALRARILDGELEPGAPLREQHLAEGYEVARHTVRAALRALANEGLVRIEAHRGAHVTDLTSADVEALGELRIALETEAARLALRRGAGRLPDPVHRAQAALAKTARTPGFAAITDAHEALHHAIVHARPLTRGSRANCGCSSPGSVPPTTAERSPPSTRHCSMTSNTGSDLKHSGDTSRHPPTRSLRR